MNKQNIDNISPDTGPPVTREATNACLVIPVEIPGVISVPANHGRVNALAAVSE